MKPLLIFFGLFLPSVILGQFSGIDSARARIYASKNEKEILLNLVAIGRFRNSMHSDSIYEYAQRIKKLATRLNDKKNIALAEYSLITGDLVKGKTDSVVLKIENNVLFKDIKKRDTALYYKLQFLKANALNRINKRTEALDLQLALLNEAEKEGNVSSQLFALNYIGATYLNVNKPAEALQTWRNALNIIEAQNNSDNEEIEAFILSNVALYHFNNYYLTKSKAVGDSFLNTIGKTIALATKNENMGVLASSLSLRGNFYGSTGRSDVGEKDIQAGLAIRKKIGDPLYIVNDFIGLAGFYFSQKNYEKCIAAVKEGLAVSDKSGIRGSEKLQLISIMAGAFKTVGNYQQYSGALEKYIAEANANNQSNAADKIAEIQTKYEVQKKETLIAQQKLGLFQQNLLLYGAGITALMLAIFFIYRFKKYQQRQKVIMDEKKKQSELAVKDAEEKERKRIAAELHDNLGVQANAILHNSTLLNNNTEDKNIVADLQDTAKEMLHNLRETLWAMKTADVQATDLWLRIINFMKQMGRHYTSIDFKIDGIPPENFTIASSQALHIVLVLQETVNNSVKHAAAKMINVTSNKTSSGWEITIADNGKGFELDTAKTKTDSYGLNNMQQRAAEGNFKYNIETVTGKGTNTTIKISAQ